MTIEQRLLALAAKATATEDAHYDSPDNEARVYAMDEACGVFTLACDPATVAALARVVEAARALVVAWTDWNAAPITEGQTLDEAMRALDALGKGRGE